eukprot:1678152-Rhodomonas_salina.1
MYRKNSLGVLSPPGGLAGDISALQSATSEHSIAQRNCTFFASEAAGAHTKKTLRALPTCRLAVQFCPARACRSAACVE